MGHKSSPLVVPGQSSQPTPRPDASHGCAFACPEAGVCLVVV